MAIFVGIHHNKVDRKGRVSVPAQFRQMLAADSFQGIVARPSHRAPAIEGCGFDFMEQLNESMVGALPFYSDSQDDMATAIFGESFMLPFDGEGRIVLPPPLMEHAGIADRASFIGKGPIFQIWNPGDLDRHRGEVLARARTQAPTLPLRQPGGGSK